MTIRPLPLQPPTALETRIAVLEAGLAVAQVDAAAIESERVERETAQRRVAEAIAAEKNASQMRVAEAVAAEKTAGDRRTAEALASEREAAQRRVDEAIAEAAAAERARLQSATSAKDTTAAVPSILNLFRPSSAPAPLPSGAPGALIEAAKAGNTARVRSSLDAGSPIDERDSVR